MEYKTDFLYKGELLRLIYDKNIDIPGLMIGLVDQEILNKDNLTRSHTRKELKKVIEETTAEAKSSYPGHCLTYQLKIDQLGVKVYAHIGDKS